MPARDTSLSHIRSALGRSLEGILQKLSPEDYEKYKPQVQDFLGCFPNAKIKMGESLLIHRSADGTICISRSVHNLLMFDYLGCRADEDAKSMDW